jgi:putative transposase
MQQQGNCRVCKTLELLCRVRSVPGKRKLLMSRWDLYIHVIWATKHRQPYLTPEKEQVAYRSILSLTQEEGYEVLELNGMDDHVHLLLKTGPKFDLSLLMKRVKGITSALLNDMIAHQERFQWQEGYYATSVTPSHLPKLRAYIQNQKEHHRAGTTHPYWEETGEESAD